MSDGITEMKREMEVPKNLEFADKPFYYGDNDPYRFALDNNLGPLEMNAIKYIQRHEKKNGAKDIDKAILTLMRLKKEKYGTSN